MKPKDGITQGLRPILDRRASEAARATDPPADDMPRMLLVCSDQVDVRLIPRLRSAGYQLTIRTNAIGTSAEVLTSKPELVLVEDSPDLPGLSGRGLAHSLVTVGIGVVLVTTEPELDRRRDLERDLSVHVLWVGERDLVGALEFIVSRHRARRA